MATPDGQKIQSKGVTETRRRRRRRERKVTGRKTQ